MNPWVPQTEDEAQPMTEASSAIMTTGAGAIFQGYLKMGPAYRAHNELDLLLSTAQISIKSLINDGLLRVEREDTTATGLKRKLNTLTIHGFLGIINLYSSYFFEKGYAHNTAYFFTAWRLFPKISKKWDILTSAENLDELPNLDLMYGKDYLSFVSQDEELTVPTGEEMQLRWWEERIQRTYRKVISFKNVFDEEMREQFYHHFFDSCFDGIPLAWINYHIYVFKKDKELWEMASAYLKEQLEKHTKIAKKYSSILKNN